MEKHDAEVVVSEALPAADSSISQPVLASATRPNLKRPIAAVEEVVIAPSPQELELARLEKVLEDAQMERRALLRQIQEMLAEQDRASRGFDDEQDEDEGGEDEEEEQDEADAELSREVPVSTTSNAASTAAEAPQQRIILPSSAAHSSPVPPLTPAEDAETTSRAQGVIKEHIRLLSKYNEIRDIGQGLIGMVAGSRRVRIRDCQEEFGVGDDD